MVPVIKPLTKLLGLIFGRQWDYHLALSSLVIDYKIVTRARIPLNAEESWIRWQSDSGHVRLSVVS